MKDEVTFVNLVFLLLWPLQLLKHIHLFMICEVTFADFLKLFCKLNLPLRCFTVVDGVPCIIITENSGLLGCDTASESILPTRQCHDRRPETSATLL